MSFQIAPQSSYMPQSLSTQRSWCPCPPKAQYRPFPMVPTQPDQSLMPGQTAPGSLSGFISNLVNTIVETIKQAVSQLVDSLLGGGQAPNQLTAAQADGVAQSEAKQAQNSGGGLLGSLLGGFSQILQIGSGILSQGGGLLGGLFSGGLLGGLGGGLVGDVIGKGGNLISKGFKSVTKAFGF